jgi:O-antigen/teichoic acid export membrane protein
VPLFTRFLGEQVYGEFIVITAIAANLSLVNVGLDQALTNQVAYERTAGGEAQIEKLVSTAFFAYVIMAAITTGVLALVSPWLCRMFVSKADEAAPIALFALGALTLISLPLKTYGTLLRGLGQVFEEQRIAAIFAVARIAGMAIVVLAGFELLGIAVVQGLTVFGAAVAAYFRSRALSLQSARISLFSFGLLRSLFAPGLAFAVLRVAGIVGFGVDSLVIGYALGPEQVTRYSVAYSLVVLCGSAVFSTLDFAILPTISSLYAQANRLRLQRYLYVVGRLALLYVGTSALGLWIGGPWFLRLWAGHGVFPGLPTFALLIVLLVIQVLLDPFWTLLVASTNHYGTAVMHTVESLLNLGLSVWWVRRFGLPGVIAGTVVARLVTTGWYIPIVASRLIDIDLSRAAQLVIPPTLLSLAASAVFLLLVVSGTTSRITPPIAAVMTALTFGVTFATLAFTREERRAAVHQVRRLSQWSIEAAQ